MTRPANEVDRRRISPPALLALATFLIHCATNGRYGYFRDEFYYIACSDHLAAGYVDHPPLSILLLTIQRWVLGDSIHALRFLPAVASAVLVWLTARFTRALGGGTFAQMLAAIAVMIAPVFLVVGNFYSMNAFEPAFWLVGALILLRIIQLDSQLDSQHDSQPDSADTAQARLWLALGLVIGLGLENKHSMLFFSFGVAVALLLTPLRRHLSNLWLWLGAFVAIGLFLPNLSWQLDNGFPTLEFMRNAQLLKNAALSPIEFLGQQILMLHPITLPLWLGGLLWLFMRGGKTYRPIAWIYLSVLIVLMAQRGKAYYLAPAYPMLFAAGATAFEAGTRDQRRWLRAGYVALLIAGGIAFAPLGLPILPPETFARYADWLGIQQGVRTENNALGQLPQHFADMFGWDEMVATVARVYQALPVEDRNRCTIFAENYGEAGAIDFLGKRYGLPSAVSSHNNYWLWGPGSTTGGLVLVVGGTQSDLAPYCQSLVQVAVTQCDYCMPFENNRPIFLCRSAPGLLANLWPRLKRFI